VFELEGSRHPITFQQPDAPAVVNKFVVESTSGSKDLACPRYAVLGVSDTLAVTMQLDIMHRADHYHARVPVRSSESMMSLL
jgi:hypothetical protein